MTIHGKACYKSLIHHNRSHEGAIMATRIIKIAAVTDAPSVTEFRRLLVERGAISDRHSLAQHVLLAHGSVVLSFCDGDTFVCITATPDATFKQALTAQSVCAHTDCAHRGCCDHSRIVRSIASN